MSKRPASLIPAADRHEINEAVSLRDATATVLREVAYVVQTSCGSHALLSAPCCRHHGHCQQPAGERSPWL
jgi:hypothetical protein